MNFSFFRRQNLFFLMKFSFLTFNSYTRLRRNGTFLQAKTIRNFVVIFATVLL